MKPKKYEVRGVFYGTVTAKDKDEAEVNATAAITAAGMEVDKFDEVNESEPSGEPEELSGERGDR